MHLPVGAWASTHSMQVATHQVVKGSLLQLYTNGYIMGEHPCWMKSGIKFKCPQFRMLWYYITASGRDCMRLRLCLISAATASPKSSASSIADPVLLCNNDQIKTQCTAVPNQYVRPEESMQLIYSQLQGAQFVALWYTYMQEVHDKLVVANKSYCICDHHFQPTYYYLTFTSFSILKCEIQMWDNNTGKSLKSSRVAQHHSYKKPVYI